ncbi:MAG: right-handed parallel beta-helix repeat-containing protein, partial [Armatimonadota bacterium]
MCPTIRRTLGLAIICVCLVACCSLAGAVNSLVVPTYFTTIQSAINAANYGDTVIVISGVYHENLNFMGKAITVRSSAPWMPSIVAATIIDGGAVAPCVTFASGESSNSVLSGFTLRNGQAINSGGYVGGGGIRCMNASPVISQNVITGNSGGDGSDGAAGGGIMCVQTTTYPMTPTITGNTISNNTTGIFLATAKGGAGIYTSNCSPVISNNIVTGNQAVAAAAGIYCNGGAPLITNNILTGNIGAFLGGGGPGGIALYNSSGAVVSNCLIADNYGGSWGGGVGCAQGTVTISNCTIARNQGPGVYLSGGTVVLDSDIIASQAMASSQPGPGIASYSADLAVKSCDVWGNVSGDYSSIASLTGTHHNISADPLFANAAAGDYRLKSHSGRWTGTNWVMDSVTSPCIDGGDPFLPFAAEPAPNGGCVNMGYDGDTQSASKSVGSGPVNNLQQHLHYTGIQAGINAASNGQTLQVVAGTYHERLDFLGKGITVRSTAPTGPSIVASTVINADGDGPVATFTHAEPASATLSGFTLTGGSGLVGANGTPLSTTSGGGVCCVGSSPTISYNVITGNAVTGNGGAVYCGGGSPSLLGNAISVNQALDGGGVFLDHCVAAHVAGCQVFWNWSSGLGGGISCGGGKASFNNCTIVGNTGNGVRLADATTDIHSSIVAYQHGLSTGVGIALVHGTAPLVTYCDTWKNAAGAYGGPAALASQTGKNGNLAKDPDFADPGAGDFWLKSTTGRWNGTVWVFDAVSSPCLDAGDPAAAYAKEPAPNGNRINMGFEGNMTHASKAPRPRVTAHQPQSTSAPRASVVSIGFSLPMDKSATQAAFSLKTVGGTTALAGTFAWSGHELRFTSKTALSANTSYRATLTTAAKSSGATPLATAFTWD